MNACESIMQQLVVNTISVHFKVAPKSQCPPPLLQRKSRVDGPFRADAEDGDDPPWGKAGFSCAVVTQTVPCGLEDSMSRFELTPWGTRSVTLQGQKWLEKSVRSENKRGHLAWAIALRKFNVLCPVLILFL